MEIQIIKSDNTDQSWSELSPKAPLNHTKKESANMISGKLNQEQMVDRLLQAYPDGSVLVNDLTGTSDHWDVYVESSSFQGLSRIEQHQSVMAVFKEELKTGDVHALSIKTKVKK